MNSYHEIKHNIKTALLEELHMTGEEEVPDDEKVKEIILRMILEQGRDRPLLLAEKERMGKELFNEVRKLDILESLFDDPEVTEIMINGAEAVFIEKKGRILPWDQHFPERERLEDMIQQMVARCNQIVNEASPVVDARLGDGSRLHVVLAPVALNGPIVTIRRFSGEAMRMKDLTGFGSITEEAAEFLKKVVRSGYNILISGGTGSGKTTFLNALSEYIPADTRVITIEDSAELQIQGIPNLVRMETRNSNLGSCQEITIRDLIRASLRMRPDRIIVGEVRGAEAIDMMQCLNTGHDGSLSTIHANSAADLIYRLETMVLMGMELPLKAIRRQIASGVDLIIHLGRTRDKSRKVLEISEIEKMEGEDICLRTLFRLQYNREDQEERLVKTNELFHTEKWEQAGYS